MKLTAFIVNCCIFFSVLLSPLNALADQSSALDAIDKSIRLREYAQAVNLLQPLLKQNNAAAQYRIAGLYRSGIGVKKNMQKALEYYTKASLNGLDDAQYALASLLEKQGSSRQKLIEIQKWYQAAADQGHRKAKRKLAALQKRIADTNSPEISHEDLFRAIRNNAVDRVQGLIERGMNMDIWDNKGRSPLMIALLSKHYEMAKLLLQHSTQLDKADINQDTPLHLATSNGYADIVLSLIDTKVDIDATDRLGNTALIIATRHDDALIMQQLLNHNADHQIQNKKQLSAPGIAQTLDLKRAKTIFKQFNIELPAQQNYVKVDINSFRKNIDKSSTLYKDWPLLNIASLLGETAIVGQLLDQGAAIDATDPGGNSALHRAAGKGRLKTLKYLLKQGGNINALNNKQETPLYIAASTGQLKVIKYLIKAGADTSLIAQNKTSPLSVAITNQHVSSATALSTTKLDPASIHTALLLALQNKMEDISLTLIKRDKLLAFSYSKNRSALWHSANLGLIRATTEILKNNNVDINLTDKNGYTALAKAITNGHTQIVSSLIDNGADIQILTRENNSILMLTVLSGNPDIFNQVVKLTKNLNTKNNAGNSALMLAAGSGNLEFVKKLIQMGANIQTRNRDDLNAYQIATNAGHDAVAKLIRDSSGKLFKLFN